MRFADTSHRLAWRHLFQCDTPIDVQIARKNRFSAPSAVRLRKPVPHKLMQSETIIYNVTLSFESCRKMLST
jgi:hypothetical protein